jgi:enoyl-CoA hydratase/carnithine racemase
MNGLVRTRVDGEAGILWLARPDKRNALNDALVDDFLTALDEFAARGVRIVVVRAEGTVFCSGSDTTELRSGAFPASERLLDALTTHDAFFVAVLEAPALGAGVALAAACPVVLVTPAASFTLPERAMGLFPSGVMTYLEPVIGARRALQLGLLGARLEAGAAREAGLVNEVVGPADLDAALGRWLEVLMADTEVTRSAAAAWRSAFSTDAFRSRKAVLDGLLARSGVRWGPA